MKVQFLSLEEEPFRYVPDRSIKLLPLVKSHFVFDFDIPEIAKEDFN
jgi:hypothetical protein